MLWGKTVVVDNRPGAGSLLSITTAGRAAADEYSTLHSSSGFTVSPSIMLNPGYDAEKDCIPGVLIASTPNIIIDSPQLPATHVPYSGASPAVAAVVVGHVEMASVAMPAAVQLIKSGKVRALAVTSNKRSKVLPDVPTIAEAGFTDFEDSTWVGLWVQKGTPAAIADKIFADVVSILAQAGR